MTTNKQDQEKGGEEESSPITFETLANRGWVSLRDFLKIAEVTYPTAIRWCKMGMIKYTQVGGVKRIYQDEIRRFLTEGTLPPNKEAQKVERERIAGFRSTYEKRKAHNIAKGYPNPNRTKGKLPTF